MKKKSLAPAAAAAVLLIAVLACSQPGRGLPPSPTIPEATSAAIPTTQPTAIPAPTDTQAPAGIAISYKGTSFLIPDTALASGAQTETVAKIDDQGGAPWDVAPEHLKFTLDGYPVQDQYISATIYVYPAKDYEDVSNGATESLKRLRAMASGAGMDINNQTVPFVPFFNASQTFLAQAMPLNFANGTGFRTVTQYDQAPLPVNNQELIYHFEGLTSDGQYYIIAIFPLNLPTLPADNNQASPVPSGGIAFTQDDPTGYYNAITAQINALAPAAFTPSLASLDALIASIKVVAP